MAMLSLYAISEFEPEVLRYFYNLCKNRKYKVSLEIELRLEALGLPRLARLSQWLAMCCFQQQR